MTRLIKIIKKKPMASLVLFIMTMLFLISYPQRASFIWAFIMHVSGAAMIGGLADWYAVTALFAKPLGISFHTALIPRSKERIISMARTMLNDEILRVPYMYRIIKEEGLMPRLLAYILSPEGKVQLRSILDNVGTNMLNHMDLKPFQEEINTAVSQGIRAWKVTPLVIQFGRSLLDEKTATVFWYYFNQTCQRVITSDAIYPYLFRIMSAILNRYSEGHLMRELGLALGGDSLSPAYLSRILQLKIVELLKKNESLQSPLGRYVWGQAIYFFNKLETNEEWQSFLEDHKNKWIFFAFESWQSQYMNASHIQWSSLWNMLMDKLDHLGQDILQDKGKQEPFERFLLMRLVSVLGWIRPIIDKMVQEQLEAYSPQDLTSMIRSRLYYDLQMIRINGSLVGAFLGGLFFLLTQVVREVLL